jgi:2-succinyl-6-hydroxy-2,4-cyclohexadiene-1-carboxylate synthase
MGARFLLHAALARPDLVERLVLISGTAGIDDEAERAARRAADDRLAERILEIGVDRFVEEWLAAPMFAGLPGWARFDDERRTNTAEGLASSLRLAGTGTQVPLWGHLGTVEVPVLVVAGVEDRKVTLRGRRLSGLLPAAEHVEVPGAGPSAHLEAPEQTADAVLRFVASMDA